MDAKQTIRATIRAALAKMDGGVRATKACLAAEKVIKLPEFHTAGVVMIYLSTDTEVDTLAIALSAWSAHKAVLVPRVNISERHMIALECKSLHAGLMPGSFGILEPVDGDAWPIESIDMVVVPGLAFDRTGHRLGQGAGFYDRFLATEGMRAMTCGLAFGEQLVDRVPVGPHDWPMDILVTDHEVIRPAQETH
ncbi:MAG: 5-formyltetrahydrofolate cyclo-ligase [Planctomycetota bacterium]|jgi:5-formyltetrahydrofolate cyclo-ligase